MLAETAGVASLVVEGWRGVVWGGLGRLAERARSVVASSRLGGVKVLSGTPQTPATTAPPHTHHTLDALTEPTTCTIIFPRTPSPHKVSSPNHTTQRTSFETHTTRGIHTGLSSRHYPYTLVTVFPHATTEINRGANGKQNCSITSTRKSNEIQDKTNATDMKGRLVYAYMLSHRDRLLDT